MKLSRSFIIIFIALAALLIGYLAFLFFGRSSLVKDLESDSLPSAVSKPSPGPTAGLLDDRFFQQLERYGEFPIPLETSGRPNPFLPY